MGAPLVANVVAKQLECGDRAVRALQRRGEVGASLGADVVLTQVECGDRALLKDPHANVPPLRNEKGVSSQSFWYL